MSKWLNRIHAAAVILFLFAAVWLVWLDYEKTKLNQRYERMIEHSEKVNEQLSELAEKLKTKLTLRK